MEVAAAELVECAVRADLTGADVIRLATAVAWARRPLKSRSGRLLLDMAFGPEPAGSDGYT